MSKVLVSFLGTGVSNSHRYESVRYEIGGQEYRTTLISEAIVKHYGIKKIIFIGTVRSMWEEVYDRFAKVNAVVQDDDYVESLLDFIDDAKMDTDIDSFPDKTKIEKVLGGDSHIVLIDYGIDKEQLKNNTKKILQLGQYLEPFDELIIDVTHGFRSLPLTIMNLLVYLKNVSDKTIDISHILYGMRDIKDEECIPLKKKKDIVPVIDLNDGDMGVMNINKWITGAYDFKSYGNGYQIQELIKAKFNELSQALQNFSDINNLNYLGNFMSVITDFKKLYNAHKDDLDLIVKLSIEPVIKELTKYKLDTTLALYQFQLNITKWQYSRKNYLAAYITLKESIISYICYKEGLDPLSYDDREKITKDGDVDAKIIGNVQYREINNIYKEINGIRNSLAHNTQARNKLDYGKLNGKVRNNIDAQLNVYIKKITIAFTR